MMVAAGQGVRNDKSLIGREIGAEAGEIWHRLEWEGDELMTPAAARDYRAIAYHMYEWPTRTKPLARRTLRVV